MKYTKKNKYIDSINSYYEEKSENSYEINIFEEKNGIKNTQSN